MKYLKQLLCLHKFKTINRKWIEMNHCGYESGYAIQIERECEKCGKVQNKLEVDMVGDDG